MQLCHSVTKYSVKMSHIYIYVYAYDKGGNRETEKIYAFTTGDTLGNTGDGSLIEYCVKMRRWRF